MKKIISLVLLSIFFFNSSYAEKYWSNKKDGPTTVKEAEKYIFSKCLEIATKDKATDEVYHCVFKNQPLYGIWYSSRLGFVAIYPLSSDSNTSYKVKLISAPRWWSNEDAKYTKDHIGTTEGTIIQKGKNNYFGYNKTWWPQNDGSYKYQTGKGKIILKSENQFIYNREAFVGLDGKNYPKKEEYFNKILPNTSYDIIKFLEKNDKSRDVTDYDIFNYASGNLLIRLNKEIEDKSEKHKFINIDSNGTIAAGIYTVDIKDKSKVNWESIFCENNILYLRNYKYSRYKLKSYCDPLKITYSTFLYYKYRYYLYGFGTILIILIWLYLAKKYRKKELANYNKKNKKKFKTYSEYEEHLQILSDIEWEKDKKKQEKEKKAQEAKRLKEEQKLEAEEKRREKLEREPVPVSVEDDNDDSLMSKIKRLKALYKNGTLTKAEFEKAKNKLLK